MGLLQGPAQARGPGAWAEAAPCWHSELSPGCRYPAPQPGQEGRRDPSAPGQALTAHFILAVLRRLQHRLRQAEPGQLFAELRQQVVREEAHGPGQRVQHEAQHRLQEGEAGGSAQASGPRSPRGWGTGLGRGPEAMAARGPQAKQAPAKSEGAGVAQATRTFRAMKTVLALTAKVSTAITTHITRSECRTSRCKAGTHERGCPPARGRPHPGSPPPRD